MADDVANRQDATSERERSRDGSTAMVYDLHLELLSAERRVERTRRRQLRGRGGAELGDFDRALAQRPVERLLEVPRDENVDET